MAEEEVIDEVEAVRAVYGEDCTVLRLYPPHLHIYIKPRTADDHSQQFVEASIEIQAGMQYPNEPPDVKITASKGLDEERLKYLNSCLHVKAHDLLSCSMLIALCEEAVETLSNMNHPDGDCPLCLDPLVSEGKQNELLPFMKLMSCFHCFHCECIIRWWNWLQTQNQANYEKAPLTTVMPSAVAHKQGSLGSCPVCRKVFHTEDIKHVMNLADSFSSKLAINEKETVEDGQLLKSDVEASRREKYERILELQKQQGGLIELRTNGVLYSSTFLSEPLPDISTTITPEATGDDDHPKVLEGDGTSSSYRPLQVPRHRQGGNSRAMETVAGPSKRENSRSKKFNKRSARSHTKQWIQKER